MTILTHRPRPDSPFTAQRAPQFPPEVDSEPYAGWFGPVDPPTWTDDGPAGTAPTGGHPWRRRTLTTAAVLALLVGGGAGGAAVAERLAGAGTAAAAPVSVDTAAVTATDSLAGVAAAVSPSIVTVFVDGTESALGSGVVLNADGLVLTNNHVIASGGTLSLGLPDGRTVPARLVAADADHDLALVQGTGLSGLTPATFGTDAGVSVGDTVLAFGSPLGLAGTVTAGIVSAVDRSVDTGTESLDHLLQTDAPINAGNSGGALVDTSGRVIGINVAIATTGDDTGSIGVGFAVPADTVTRVVRRLTTQAD